MDYRGRLEKGRYYHVYNRGNNKESIFFKEENYRFFLQRFDYFLADYVDVFAWCLLPNHFHYLIRVKEGAENVSHLQNVKHLDSDVSQRFQALFTSYVKAINIQQNRTGSLFQKPFKRIEVDSEEYLRNVVFYIHANPQLHRITDDFRMHPWSSYNGILKNMPDNLKKDSVMKWFASKENYISYHNKDVDISELKKLIIE